MRLNKFVLCILLIVGTAVAADPEVGTWKINIEKSKLRNPAAWKGRIMIIEQVGPDTRRVIFEIPNAKGGLDKQWISAPRRKTRPVAHRERLPSHRRLTHIMSAPSSREMAKRLQSWRA
jgi:hypothetical protein